MMNVAFSFLGEYESRKKRERLSTGLGYDPDKKLRSSFSFSKVKVLEGTPHGMKNSVLTLYFLYFYLFLDILTCIKCSFKVFGLFILVNNGKKSAMGFRVEFIYLFC